MERDIRNGEMIEYGVLSGFYTGISINSIRRVINSGKTCLLVLSPESIKLVRQPELRPFIVYFISPSAEQMKQSWVKQKVIKVCPWLSLIDSLINTVPLPSPPLPLSPQSSEVLDIVRQAGHLESTYSHYFDHQLPFSGLEQAIRNVVAVATSLQNNDQWVPASWIRQ